MKTVSASLLNAACQGDPEALESLLAQVRPDVLRFARRVCATTEDAEDAVQLTLWKLYRHVGTLRALPALAGWLFRVVERECFRLFRALRGATQLDSAIEATLQAAPSQHDLRRDLVAAIAALPEEFREVLVLRDIDQLSTPETAQQLGISVATVKMRLHRARAMLRVRLIAGCYTSAAPTEQA